MNKLFRTLGMWMLVASVLSLSLTACDDKSDEGGTTRLINPSRVFPGTRLTELNLSQDASGNMKFTYDAKGILVSVNNGGDSIAFEYSDGDEVIMKSVSRNNLSKIFTYRITIGADGFASQCKQTYSGDSGVETWSFKYNNAGQLVEMKRSEGDNEITKLIYNNDGDIITSKMTSDDADNSSEFTISYTSSKVTSPIDNKGGIMLWDDTFGVDMDEMVCAYYAGLLGMPTKHLPIKDNHIKDEIPMEYSTEWTLNTNNYPSKAVQSNSYNEATSILNFVW